MQVNSLTYLNWFFQAWNHRTSIIACFLAIISLSVAHYAGFFFKVPSQIVAVAGVPLAKGITATFLFYLFFCAVTARAAVSIVQLILLPFLAINDRFGHKDGMKMDWSHKRRFVRSHIQFIKWEGYIWLIIQAFIFSLIMVVIYVNPALTLLNVIKTFVSLVLVILCFLIRAGFFLQPKLDIFIRKVKSRPARLGRVVSGAFVTGTGALIIVSFFLGAMRADFLREQKPHFVMTKEFSGMATVIASSEGALLLLQKNGSELRYIYFATDFTATLETKPVFSPLKINKT